MTDLARAAEALLDVLENAKLGDDPSDAHFDSGWGVVEKMDALRREIEALAPGEGVVTRWLCEATQGKAAVATDGPWYAANIYSLPDGSGCHNNPDIAREFSWATKAEAEAWINDAERPKRVGFVAREHGWAPITEEMRARALLKEARDEIIALNKTLHPYYLPMPGDVAPRIDAFFRSQP